MKFTLLKTTFLVLLFNFYVNASISNSFEKPIPNLKETKYIELEQWRILDPDLGNEQYLFLPFSIAVDLKNNLYVYDLLQAKIFKFDKNLKLLKSFGKKGKSKGNFSGTGKKYPVFICIGRDGMLYASDIRMKKIILFDTNGKCLREIQNVHLNDYPPLVDNKGIFYSISVKDKIISLSNQSNEILFNIEDQKENFNYLISEPDRGYMLLIENKNRLDKELEATFTANSKLLIFFSPSSTMLLYDPYRKNCQTMRLWPQKAIMSHGIRLEKLKNAGDGRYMTLFSKLLVDNNKSDDYYLHYGINEEMGMNALYHFNVKGQLLDVYYIKHKPTDTFIRFEAKMGDLFVAVRDENIIILKEKRK